MIFIYLGISIVAVLADQLTKLWLYGKSFSMIGDFLWVESSFNTGAAYSMLSGAKWFFIVIAIISSLLMIYLLFTKKYNLSKFSKISMALVLGGAIGNLIDRIALGGVRDFIYFKSINFAIFNFADIFVTIGGILLVISLIITMCKTYKKDDKSVRT